MYKYPLEYALFIFADNKFNGQIVPELLDLSQRGIVRYVDIVFFQKDADGGIRSIELNDLDEEAYKQFVPMGEYVNSFFGQEDLDLAASKLPNNSAAALFLWENLWAENISNAIVNSGGVLYERGQIPAEVVEEVRQELTADS
jgi:hypothetical protein